MFVSNKDIMRKIKNSILLEIDFFLFTDACCCLICCLVVCFCVCVCVCWGERNLTYCGKKYPISTITSFPAGT